jgi:hypothetical protein
VGVTDPSYVEVDGLGINAGDLVLADAVGCPIERRR